MNITESIARNAAAFPDRVALIVNGRPCTYKTMWKSVYLVSYRLHEAGVRRGDCVALRLPDGLAFVVTVLALARMGAAALPFRQNEQKQDFKEQLLRRHEVRYLLAEADYEFPGRHSLSIALLQSKDVFSVPEGGRFKAPEIVSDADDLPWWVGLTSGTTGVPKSFVRKHAREVMLSSVYPGAEHDYYERVSVWVNCGMSLGMSALLRVLQEGSTAVVKAESTPEAFFTHLLRDRPTCIITSTGNAGTLIQHLKSSGEPPEKYRSIVKRFVMGGSVASPNLIAGLKNLLCEQVEIRYASSESGLVAIVDDNVRKNSPNCHGRLFPWVQAQALDSDGNVLAPSQIGALRFKTPFTIDEYVGDPEASAKAFRDGWHYPGDRGAVDAGGYLFLAGRTDAVINIGGDKVDAEIIEAALNSHPDVLESAVTAFRTDGLHKIVAAVVTSATIDPEVLKQICREKIGTKGVPYHIAFTKALPKNEGGKIRRNAVAAMFSVVPKQDDLNVL